MGPARRARGARLLGLRLPKRQARGRRIGQSHRRSRRSEAHHRNAKDADSRGCREPRFRSEGAGETVMASRSARAARIRLRRKSMYACEKQEQQPAGFDMVFVTWGAIIWLPDICRWAEIVAHFLKPGGSLYLAECHPAALVFDDAASVEDGRPGLFAPYFSRKPVVMDVTHDYVDDTATLHNATTHTWIHPLGDLISSLLTAGLSLDWLHEHDAVTWRMFKILKLDALGLWRWPDQPWLPLAFSLRATRR